MREAVKAARSFVSAPAWSDYIISEYGAFGQAHTDEELDAYIRNNTDTIDHPVGTVAMGKGSEGALDSKLRVKGTIGLRVVYASAFVSISSYSDIFFWLSTKTTALHSVWSYARPDLHPCRARGRAHPRGLEMMTCSATKNTY